jgi:hypothetical protein
VGDVGAPISSTGLWCIAALRLRLAAGASGAGFGVNAGGSGGSGYWRRYVGLSLSGWF